MKTEIQFTQVGHHMTALPPGTRTLGTSTGGQGGDGGAGGQGGAGVGPGGQALTRNTCTHSTLTTTTFMMIIKYL